MLMRRDGGGGGGGRRVWIGGMGNTRVIGTGKEERRIDEDNDEIRKLAKQARKAKEKAEAKARAEARKAEAEARRKEAEMRRAEATKASKKRLKAFPIPGSAKRLAKRRPVDPDTPVAHVPSTPSFARARSEPVPSRTPSPTKSPSKARASQSRASSHSPIPRQSPNFDFNYDCQEDGGVFHFNDDDEPMIERDLSPGPFPPPFSDFEPPSSPSVPPTTSGASAGPSNVEDSPNSHSGTEEEESESDSQPKLSAKDRKRLRVLRRMMPAAMIARQIGKRLSPPPSSNALRARAVVEVSSGSEVEEVRGVVPGLARVRRGFRRDVEVRGDPESSDVERL
ncbi:hypothetical protein HYDPIDRAFT_44920, partial [Hydnomerulius pinastri MD-312]